jgi:mannose-1-phosphate guanylyltransferase
MIVPVILSGGSGSRLWPLSRKLYPKQFLSLVNETTLFQDTITRLPKELSSPLIICNEEHRFIVAEQLRQIKSDNQGIILEPIGKNTAPAIALAAFNFLNHANDPTLLVLSADHLIEEGIEFSKSIKIASNVANDGKLVTIGVKPTKAETGYGYIKTISSKKDDYYKIISFVEKPSLELAKEYLASGDFYWNSGIFLFKASTYLNELEIYEPEIYYACKKSYLNSNRDLDFIRPNNQEFSKSPDKSIDYALMEKTKIGVVVPFKGKWSDIGSWSSLWSSKSKDNNNNVSHGDTILNKVQNSYIYSSGKLVAANDISDLVIIDTSDALLVSSKKSSENIKYIVSKIKQDGRSESDFHRKVFRPWGYYDSIEYGDGFQVKRICVNPGAKLSLQKHKKRAEHWVVVNGIAKITCGDKVFKLKGNESTYIPKGELHRLENEEETKLEIIEIQTGSYLGEDDIIRIEDDYHRDY